MNRSAGRTLVLTVLILCTSVAVAGGAIAESSPVGDSEEATVTSDGSVITVIPSAVGPAVTVSVDEDSGNETQRHRNPDEYDEDDDLEEVEAWLTGWMANSLGEGAIQLSEGEYELAREYVGEEYRDRLGQYVDVAGETDGESYEETFRDARDEQVRLVDLIEDYRETQEEYEEALEDGDTERARELARELDEIAEEINDSTANLQDLYEDIEEQTGEDLSDAKVAVEELNHEIQSEQAEIRASEFVETELVVESDDQAISFLTPLVATGQLRTVDGDPVSNEPIRLTVGNETIRTETDADGAFTFEYRPTDLPLSTSTLSVEYIPDDHSVYLGSEASVDVTVEQVEPTVVGLSTPDELAYGDSATVSGELVVDGVPVDDVPLNVIVDGQQIGTVQVSDGSFDESVDIPASVLDGERSLVVRLDYEDRALAGVSESRTVTVRETDTVLSVTATQVGEREVRVSGVLETVNGDGVEGEPIHVSIDGVTVGTVTTAENGMFAETVTVSDSVEYTEYSVRVSYRASGSNLAQSDAETVVELEPIDGSNEQRPNDESSLLGGIVGDDGVTSTDPSDIVDSVRGIVGDDGLPTWVWLASGIGLLVVVTLLWAAFRPAREGIPYTDHPIVASFLGPIRGLRNESDDDASESVDGPAGTDPGTGRASPSPSVSLLQHASDHLQAGRPDLAVRACYSAVREDLDSRMDAAGALTHWEFYRAYRHEEPDRSTVDESSADALRTLTEEYERATFSAEYVTTDEARTVLDHARRLCRVGDSEPETEPGGIADD